eukprot:6371071-Alexandrium_andersonii.AAC.1
MTSRTRGKGKQVPRRAVPERLSICVCTFFMERAELGKAEMAAAAAAAAVAVSACVRAVALHRPL